MPQPTDKVPPIELAELYKALETPDFFLSTVGQAGVHPQEGKRLEGCLEDALDRVCTDAWQQFLDARSRETRISTNLAVEASGVPYETYSETIVPIRSRIYEACGARVAEAAERFDALQDEEIAEFIGLRFRGLAFQMGLEILYPHPSSLLFAPLMMSWYLRGRLPCGWVGKYPSGLTLVY